MIVNKKIFLTINFLLSLISCSVSVAMRIAKKSQNQLDSSFLTLIAQGDLDGVQERYAQRHGAVDLNVGIYNRKDRSTQRPLEVAIKNNQYTIAQWLLNNGATASALSAERNTMLGVALLYLAKHPHQAHAMVQLLLEHGAHPNAFITDTSIYGGWGQCTTTPLEQALFCVEEADKENDKARAYGFQKIAQALAAAGGKINDMHRLSAYLDKPFNAEPGQEQDIQTEPAYEEIFSDSSDSCETRGLLPASKLKKRQKQAGIYI